MDYIREFLRSRWDSEKQLLNLENMGADPILKNHAIRPPGDSRANEFVGPAMMKLAGEMFPNVCGDQQWNMDDFSHDMIDRVDYFCT